MFAPHLLLETSGVVANMQQNATGFQEMSPEARGGTVASGRLARLSTPPPAVASAGIGRAFRGDPSRGGMMSDAPRACRRRPTRRGQSSYQCGICDCEVTIRKGSDSMPKESAGNRIGIALRWWCVDEADGLARCCRRIAQDPWDGDKQVGPQVARGTAVRNWGEARAWSGICLTD